MFAGTSTELRKAVTAFAAGFDAELIDAEDAARVVSEWAAIEHAAATVKAIAASRVATTSAWRRGGAPTAADWLARTTGTTAAKARQQLETAERLAELDATAAAARRGEVSPDQAAAIADAATANPTAEEGLLAAAARESLGELRERCQRTKAAADPDPDATRRRLHDARALRRYGTPDGMQHLHASGPADLLARVDAALRPIVDETFAAARADGRRDAPDAYAFDALVTLADRAVGADQRATGSRYRAVLRVDWEAFLRGWVEDNEVCEIAGLGPVSVARAREVLGESTMHLVITRGVDVANVTYLGRGASAAQRIALLWQMPACTRLGCNRRSRLQNDHRTPWAQRQVTELENLDPLCAHDHDLKTRHGWSLVAGKGKRLLVPPDHPDHPRARAPSVSL